MENHFYHIRWPPLIVYNFHYIHAKLHNGSFANEKYALSMRRLNVVSIWLVMTGVDTIFARKIINDKKLLKIRLILHVLMIYVPVYSHISMISCLPRLNQYYKAENKVSFSMTQWVSNRRPLNLHWATCTALLWYFVLKIMFAFGSSLIWVYIACKTGYLRT